MDADRLLAEEGTGWQTLLDVFASIPHDRVEDASLTADGWSPKDVMFHIGAWCAEAANQLERMRLGTFAEGTTDTETKNREWFETSRRLDVPTVRAELRPARERMLREWQALGEITPSAQEWFEESGSMHYREHIRDLRAWMERG
jgi:mycothiol maleylpyruvate isomerase-like protein